jgi:hypothetical protein
MESATLFEEDIESVRPQLRASNHRLAGIDPGLDGAIVIVAPGESPVKLVMPCVDLPQKDKSKAAKRFYDLPAIRSFLVDQDVAVVYLEQQNAQSRPMPQRCKNCGTIVNIAPTQGILSTFNTGRGYGALEGLLAGLQLSYKLVHPRTWQSKMLPAGSGDSKGRATLAAKALFPKLDLRANERCRIAHDGICDALLIATFGQREMMWTDPEDPDLGF